MHHVFSAFIVLKSPFKSFFVTLPNVLVKVNSLFTKRRSIDEFIILCSMFNAIYMRIINLAGYFKNGIGENCPASQIIDTESECKNSADVLGLSFVGSFISIGYPAGCYWKKDGHAFFNRIIDPSQTKQERFGNRGGVCVGTGKHKNIISESTSLR